MKLTKYLAALMGGVAVYLASAVSSHAADSITQAELVRRTQELYDAVAPGNQVPWKKYFADDCLFFDEKGRSMDKTALVADITPMPPGYSGTITLRHPQSRIDREFAILSYDADETEMVFGQHLTARYHTTDTWRQRHGEWQIIATQTNRYYEDPPLGRADPEHFSDYVGVYELTPGKTLKVTVTAGHLSMQRGTGEPEALQPEAGDIFFRTGVEGRTVFRRSASGTVDALLSRRNNEDIVWQKLNSPTAASTR